MFRNKNYLYFSLKLLITMNYKYKNLTFNYFTRIIILLLTIVIISCSPQSKESYLESYKEFIFDIRKSKNTTTEKEWIEIEEKYQKFTDEWYNKFKDDFTWKEKLLLSKYDFQYNLLKIKEDSSFLVNIFSEKDYERLKEQIKYYSENEMDDDIKFIIEQAQEIGAEASNKLEIILKELKMNIEKYEE